MRVEMNAEEIEQKLRDKERMISQRLQRMMPSHGGASPLGGMPLLQGVKMRKILLAAGGALTLLGLPSEVRPRRVEARLRPNRLGQLAFVTGLTLLAFAVGRRLGQQKMRGFVFDARIAPKGPPSAGAHP